jgi:SAM-dependent methyltransferase
VRVRVLVDLACGTGNTTIPWVGHGWTVIGVDRSAAMLREARRKSRRVRWYWQDLTELDIDERADLVTCHFDALNHVLDARDLQRVFVNVSRMMNDTALFQFDMNTDHKLRWLSVREKLFRVGPNYFMAHNEYDRRTRVATFHQLWFVRKGKLYKKREICVRERSYPDVQILRMLKKAGLRLEQRKVQRKVEGKPDRVLYLARKVAGRPTGGSPVRAELRPSHPAHLTGEAI